MAAATRSGTLVRSGTIMAAVKFAILRNALSWRNFALATGMTAGFHILSFPIFLVAAQHTRSSSTSLDPNRADNRNA
jgi:hypothetical protein